jgi:hypothetical protein
MKGISVGGRGRVDGRRLRRDCRWCLAARGRGWVSWWCGWKIGFVGGDSGMGKEEFRETCLPYLVVLEVAFADAFEPF